MTDYTDLIARLEAATEGSRELSARVGLAVGNWKIQGRAIGVKEGAEYHWVAYRAWNYNDNTAISVIKRCSSLRDYSESLDAALTLMPEGASCWGLDHSPAGVCFYWSGDTVTEWYRYAEGRHKTSDALACCIAALRARAEPHAGTVVM